MRLPRSVRSRMRSKVIVTLKSGESFQGILYEADGGAVVLRDSVAVGAGEKHTDLPLDGEMLLFTADISYIQRP